MSIIFNEAAKTYPNGVAALKKCSLAINKGEFVAVIGPSGAGKTTLIRLINGLEEASTGKVTVDELTVCRHHYKAIRQQVGMIFQHFNLISQLNVMTNVLTGRLSRLHWLRSFFYLFSKGDLEIGKEALDQVELTEKAWIRADQLSGGQQQRVGIARALAQKPGIILADEPVASLDPVSGRGILNLLQKICREKKITIVANLHQIALAREFATRVIGLHAGEIVFDGPPQKLSEEILHVIYHGKEKGNAQQLAVADL